MRPVILQDTHTTLPPRLCAGVEHYAAAWVCSSSVQDWTRPFDKREKATHRFDIADTRGQLSLTVPIVKPQTSRCRWDEIQISTHGAWWDVHRVALESAYGRTPYFEFYIDRFLPMLTVGVETRFPLLRDLALDWDREIRSILSIANPAEIPAGVWDVPAARSFPLPPYRQIRADRLGFIPALSILDLIFNLGPESQFYLNDLALRMMGQKS